MIKVSFNFDGQKDKFKEKENLDVYDFGRFITGVVVDMYGSRDLESFLKGIKKEIDTVKTQKERGQ